MDKNKFIEDIYKKHLVEKWCWKNLAKYRDIKEDLISECYLNICQIPQETFDDLFEQGEDHLTAYLRKFVILGTTPNGFCRKLILAHLKHITGLTFDYEDDKDGGWYISNTEFNKKVNNDEND